MADDLSRACMLLSNDDGIHAEGLAVLEEIARTLSDNVWVVAPEVEQSAASHSLTLRRPLRERKLGDQRYSIDGTPTDCVLMAIKYLMQDKQPDLVLSGVNIGANLGEDVIYSGTVAAAMEGAILGVRSVAFSLRPDEESEGRFHWDTVRKFGPEIIQKLARWTEPGNLLFNVNFPGIPPEKVQGIRVCRQGHRDEGTTVVEGKDPGGRPYLWVGQFVSHHTSVPNADLTSIAENYITVTPLKYDLTDHAVLSRMDGLFS
ncbi:5'/3'-nucleotidase SurE [Kiloniella laminariae]|uniref:5'-nucleotidase SurE n=1 Tax=Kiloniella laminariae TaxID=454162 RepID=A0ABT4LNA0_9PROT|nr:5'/3'-nucleotidase SurE [Kiloniella laminariae]MCZ4282625.1 5'/3'-nucleotidase SurE [Kiloniella laminariae]